MSAVLGSVGGRFGQFGQVDAVVFAEPVDQGGSLVQELTGGKFAFVELFFQLADPISAALGFVDRSGPFGAKRFAQVDVADRFPAKSFFLQKELGQLRLGRQDLGLGFVDAIDAARQLLAAVGQGALPFVAVVRELPQLVSQMIELLFSAGQFDFRRNRLAIAQLAAFIQFGDAPRVFMDAAFGLS